MRAGGSAPLLPRGRPAPRAGPPHRDLAQGTPLPPVVRIATRRQGGWLYVGRIPPAWGGGRRGIALLFLRWMQVGVEGFLIPTHLSHAVATLASWKKGPHPRLDEAINSDSGWGEDGGGGRGLRPGRCVTPEVGHPLRHHRRNGRRWQLPRPRLSLWHPNRRLTEMNPENTFFSEDRHTASRLDQCGHLEGFGALGCREEKPRCRRPPPDAAADAGGGPPRPPPAHPRAEMRK